MFKVFQIKVNPQLCPCFLHGKFSIHPNLMNFSVYWMGVYLKNRKVYLLILMGLTEIENNWKKSKNDSQHIEMNCHFEFLNFIQNYNYA